jgi:hypothetical protein
MYFKDSNVIFKTLYLDYIFKCDVFNDVELILKFRIS